MGVRSCFEDGGRLHLRRRLAAWKRCINGVLWVVLAWHPLAMHLVHTTQVGRTSVFVRHDQKAGPAPDADSLVTHADKACLSTI